MRIRRWFALLSVVGVFAVPAAGWSQQDAASPAARVKAALAAMGGAEALASIRRIVMKGRAEYWEPEQSYRAGGEMRRLGEADFTWRRDLAGGAARIDLERRYVYPFPGREEYSELLVGGAGYVVPRGASAAPRAMSGVRVVATEREALRSSPAFLLKLARTPSALKPLPDQPAGPARLPAIAAEIDGYAFHILFDPQTNLPARIRAFDFDQIQGDSTFDLVLGGWKRVGAVKIAHSIGMELNGRAVARYEIAEAAVNPTLPADAFAVPAGLKPAADRMSLKDDSEEIRIIRIDNPHAEGMLIMEVVKAKLGFVTDLWSPGLQRTWGPGPAAVLAAVRKAGIAPERFAGGAWQRRPLCRA